MAAIVFAGYGYSTQTKDVTTIVKNGYGLGVRKFVANNTSFGGDPAPGKVKDLFIVWQQNGSTTSAVVQEGESIALP